MKKKKKKKKGTETSVKDYHSTFRNTAEERRSQIAWSSYLVMKMPYMPQGFHSLQRRRRSLQTSLCKCASVQVPAYRINTRCAYSTAQRKWKPANVTARCNPTSWQHCEKYGFGVTLAVHIHRKFKTKVTVLSIRGAVLLKPTTRHLTSRYYTGCSN